MKKLYFVLLLQFLTGMLIAQDPVITFRFSNYQIIPGTPDTAQFDVDIKCDQPGTYHRDMQIYINYNSTGFGSNIYTNNRIVVEKLALMNETASGADKYYIVAMNDNTSSRFALATESNFPNFDPTSFPMFYTPVTTDFQGFLRFKIAITDDSELAGISFAQSLMNGGQYYQGNANPIAYQNPSLYDNNLENEPLWFATSNTIWTGTNSTSWFDGGNWSDNIPWVQTNVIIPDVSSTSGNFPLVNEGVQVNSLTIQPGGQLSISGSKAVFNVNGDLLLQSNETATGSVIESGNLSVSGNTVVQQYITVDEWNYISSPVQNETAAAFADKWLKYFNEPTNDWTYIYEPTHELEFMKGYACWSSESGIVEFTGVLNHLEQATTLAFTDDDPHGFNLVGNPYPSGIDWDLITPGNKLNLDASIYVWDGIKYLTWNGSLGDLGDGIIPPMQSFFVHANSESPSLTIDFNARVHTQKAFYKTDNNLGDLENYLAFKIDNNVFTDMTFLHFHPGSSTGFDQDFDAYKLFGIEESPSIYSNISEKKYAINVMPEIDPDLVVPIYVEVGTEGTYQIHIDGILSFNPLTTLFLEDLKTGFIYNLQASNAFEIHCNPEDDKHRFNLHFSDVSYLPSIETSITFLVYGENDIIHIQQDDSQANSYDYEIYSVLGKLLKKGRINGSLHERIFVDSKYPIVIVRIASDKEIINRKINLF